MGVCVVPVEFFVGLLRRVTVVCIGALALETWLEKLPVSRRSQVLIVVDVNLVDGTVLTTLLLDGTRLLYRVLLLLDVEVEAAALEDLAQVGLLNSVVADVVVRLLEEDLHLGFELLCLFVALLIVFFLVFFIRVVVLMERIT